MCCVITSLNTFSIRECRAWHSRNNDAGTHRKWCGTGNILLVVKPAKTSYALARLKTSTFLWLTISKWLSERDRDFLRVMLPKKGQKQGNAQKWNATVKDRNRESTLHLQASHSFRISGNCSSKRRCNAHVATIGVAKTNPKSKVREYSFKGQLQPVSVFCSLM